MRGDSDQLRLIDDGGPGGVRRIRRATDETIRALRRGGRLEDVDALLVALLRTCADRCDEFRGTDEKFHENQALRLQAELEARLRTLGGPGGDAFDQLLAAAAGPAPAGD